MVTRNEAVRAMNIMIDSLPIGFNPENEDYYFLVSKEVAQHLSDYAHTMSGKPEGSSPDMTKFQTFFWKGIKCKVA